MNTEPFSKWADENGATAPSVKTPAVAPLDDDAFHGLAGLIVRKIAPHTEADPAAMLIQLLVAFGNCVGRGPHFRIEDTPHFANEFAVVVGESAKARKGTSFNRISGLLEMADADWRRDCHVHGLVSGEGIVWNIKDDMPGKKPDEIVPGVKDKRLLIVEDELGGALSAAARKENTLTAILRSAWDGKDLRTLAKNCPAKATAPHVSLIGHVTFDELQSKLRGDALSNGFANRFLWIFASRTKLLPLGGTLRTGDLQREGEALRRAVEYARTLGELERDEETSELWCDAYTWLSAERAGTVGSVTSRMEAHAIRLSLKYALLDGSRVISAPHLRAALAVCKYAIRSAEHCFGGLNADARAILNALTARSPGEMPRTDITRDVFNGHRNTAQLDIALRELQSAGLADCRQEQTSGAPRELWRAAKKAN